MKKKHNRPAGKYFHPKIYVDDVREIAKILEEYSGGVVVEDDDNEYEDIEDYIKSLKGIRHSLKLTCKSPDAFVHINSDRSLYSTMSVPGDDDKALAAYQKLDNVLKAGDRNSLLNYVHYALFASLFWVFMDFLQRVIHHLEPLTLWSLAMYTAFIIGVVITITRHLMRSEIHNTVRGEELPFFKRKKDDIILLIIGAVIGVFLTLVGNSVVASLNPPAKGSPTSSVSGPAPDK